MGNAAIAGHRTTHLAPFFDIDKLQPGDEITVITLNGRYVYHVTGTEIVAPDDYASVIPTTDVTKATLTLVSCTPRYSATNRIIVRSELVPDQIRCPHRGGAGRAALRCPTIPRPRSPTRARSRVVDTVGPTTTVAPATVDRRLGSAPSTTSPPTPSRPTPPPSRRLPQPRHPTHSATAGSATRRPSCRPSCGACCLAAVGYGIYWLSHKVRRYWVGILAGFVPFIVVLYFFYENINRLLPPNL